MLKNHRFLAAGLLAAGVCLVAPACASIGYGSYQHDHQRGNQDFERRGYDAGYRDGLSHGADDARHRRELQIDRDGDYRHAEEGYRREYGDREAYRHSYRRGYETGYTEAFNRGARSFGYHGPVVQIYPNGSASVLYPRQGDRHFASPAGQNGYRDGLEVGRRDARDGQRSDPVRAKWYRSGDRDYDEHDGSRDDYRREYRAAFQQGYEENFRDGRAW